MLAPRTRRHEALSGGKKVNPRKAISCAPYWSFTALSHDIDFQQGRGIPSTYT